MTTIKIALKPFSTPNFVLLNFPAGERQHGFKESPTVPLSEVDADSLAKLCDDFREEIFRKAGKRDPAFVKTGE